MMLDLAYNFLEATDIESSNFMRGLFQCFLGKDQGSMTMRACERRARFCFIVV